MTTSLFECRRCRRVYHPTINRRICPEPGCMGVLVETEVKPRYKLICRECHGTGVDPETMTNCKTCKGTGQA